MPIVVERLSSRVTIGVAPFALGGKTPHGHNPGFSCCARSTKRPASVSARLASFTVGGSQRFVLGVGAIGKKTSSAHKFLALGHYLHAQHPGFVSLLWVFAGALMPASHVETEPHRSVHPCATEKGAQ